MRILEVLQVEFLPNLTWCKTAAQQSVVFVVWFWCAIHFQ